MNKRTIWIIVAVVVVVVAAGIFIFAGTGSAPSGNTPSGNTEQAASAPAPTSGEQVAQPSGDPDTIAADLLNDTAQLDPTPTESDPSLVASSTDLSNSLDQSLDVSQF